MSHGAVDTESHHIQTSALEIESRERSPSKVVEFVKTTIRSTPYKAVVHRVGGRLCSILLAAALLSIAVLFYFVNPLEFESDICTSPSDSAAVYIEKYKNLTNYEGLYLIGNQSRDLTDSLYATASSRYKGRENTSWPKPYETDLADLYEVSLEDCTEEKKFCIDSWGLGVICKTFTIPCAISFDLVNTETKGNVSGLHFGGEWDDSEYTDLSNVSLGALESAVESGFHEILNRANSVGSFYCIYKAAMIFVGAPYVLTSYRLKTNIQFVAGGLSKPWFIICILLIWYSLEIAQLFYQEFVIKLNILQILGFALKDPCFLDADFMNEVYTNTTRICEQIDHSRYLFESSGRNLAYYSSIEETYKYLYWTDGDEQVFYGYGTCILGKGALCIRETLYLVPASNRLFVGDVLSDEGILWQNGTIDCSIDTMLDDIGPSGSLDFWGFALFLGAIAAILIQPTLANFVESVFVMIDPLSPFYGRVVIPFKESSDTPRGAGPNFMRQRSIKEFRDEVKTQKLLKRIRSFERQKNVCPLCFWLTVTILLVVTIKVAIIAEL